jgi:hypothetical protein
MIEAQERQEKLKQEHPFLSSAPHPLDPTKNSLLHSEAA